MHRYLEGGEDLYLYTRYENPTLRELESRLAVLEEAEAAVVFASGMAASTTGILSTVKAGDEVLASASLYGGVTRFVRDILPNLGIKTRIVPTADLLRLDKVASDRSRLLLLESPTNPSVEVLDLRTIAAAAHDKGIAVMVDNTFATPICRSRSAWAPTS
jgi:cystathionine beta-lyase/cystathionine gamma-synthase